MEVLSHQSAARIWGLPLLTDDGRVHVTVPRNSSHRPTGIVRHRATLERGDVRFVDGVAVTSELRTVLDLARTSHETQGLAAADFSLRMGMVTESALSTSATRARGPGAGRVRWVARYADRRAGSFLESEGRARFLLGGIGPFELQVRLADDAEGHPFDLWVVGTKLVIEIDGSGHNDERRRRFDAEDGIEAVLGDHELLRFTGHHVRRRWQWMVGVTAARFQVHKTRAAREANAARKRRAAAARRLPA